MPSLVIERGQEKGFSFTLRPGVPTVIGRDPTAQVIISDPAASRRHFQIRITDGIWLVSDLGSRNATYVNEEKLEREQALAFGDRIQVGETVFSFLEEEQTDKGRAGGLIGKDIAGYKILDRIGRGGMGTVYKARQMSLNRMVALKILSARYASDPAFVERFVAEARAAAQLNHPNVVQVFDVGQAGGLHFFSMEFMEGGAVQDLVAKREDSRLPWIEALPMVMDAARGLVFAERHGIVHRDIKPDNLMLTVENKVKIGDLGLAARSDEVGDGKIFGTPHFIAPEQARGRDVTHAADIYSLGASFYRMVVGRTPFGGQTVKEILRAQINDPHVPVINEVPDFPPDLSAIIDKMMAKRVEDRYASATELLEALEAFQIAHQIELAGGRRPSKRILAIGLLAILGLGGVATWLWMRGPETKVEYKEVIKEGPTDNRPEGPIKTAEDVRKEKELAAQNAYLQLKLKEPKSEWREGRAEWLEQAKAFDDLAKAHVGTPAARDATARATEIRERIETAEREYQETVGRAKTWWERTKAGIDTALGEQDWTRAVSGAHDVLTGAELKQHAAYVPDAKTYLDGVEGDALRRARASFDSALAAASQQIDDGHPSEAMKAVEDWESRMRVHEAAHATFKQLADDAKAWREERADTLRAELEELLVQDRMLYATAQRSVRTLDQDAAAPRVFELEFGACATVFRKAAEGLHTWVYQDRAAARAARLDRAEAAWAEFVQFVADGKLVKADEPIVGIPGLPPGSRATLSTQKPTNREFLQADVSAGPAKAGRSFRWADFYPSTIWEALVRDRVDRIPGPLALGLAHAFVELAHAEAAAALLERAKSAGAAPDVDEGVALEAEIAALREYDALRASAGAGQPEERMRRITQWRERHVLTDAFLLLDGREVSALPQLLTTSERDRFLDSWGVRPTK